MAPERNAAAACAALDELRGPCQLQPPLPRGYETVIQPWQTIEDGVARDELEAELQSSGCHPTVGLMELLPKGMTQPSGMIPEEGTSSNEFVARLDSHELDQRSLKASAPQLAPALPSMHRSEAR